MPEFEFDQRIVVAEAFQHSGRKEWRVLWGAGGGKRKFLFADGQTERRSLQDAG
jgi:hypothetical protein